MSKPKKMGRPKLPKAQRRGDPFPSVRLLPDEDKQVRDAIKRSGKAQSNWIKNALLAYSSGDSV